MIVIIAICRLHQYGCCYYDGYVMVSDSKDEKKVKSIPDLPVHWLDKWGRHFFSQSTIIPPLNLEKGYILKKKKKEDRWWIMIVVINFFFVTKKEIQTCMFSQGYVYLLCFEIEYAKVSVLLFVDYNNLDCSLQLGLC